MDEAEPGEAGFDIDGADLLSPDQLSQRYAGAVSVQVLERWRWQKIGPDYLRIGGAVFYRLADLEAWERRYTRDDDAADLPYAEQRRRDRQFITPDQLSQRYGGKVALATIERWRWQKTGPAYFKLGATVLYCVDDVERWENRCRIRTDGRAPRTMVSARRA